MALMVGGNAGGFDIGVAPDALWIAAKVFNDARQSDLAKLHQGFQWVLDPDGDTSSADAPAIVNNSWNLQSTVDQCNQEFAPDITALRAAGIAVVFAAGNYGPDEATSASPANDLGSLSVGAVDSAASVTGFSSRGPSACGDGLYPGVAAPGKDVLTAGLTSNGLNPENYAFGTGTSFAAPHVAGALALLKGAFPDASISELERAVNEGAFDLGAAGPDNDSGAGLLDLVEAYFLLSGLVPPPADADGDGVSDDRDLCPGTPAGEPVDADGCPMPIATMDEDGDGYTIDQDCDDGDPSVHPGASEIRFDGVDQDCNGYDLTIDITSASYDSRSDKLDVTATSALGQDAALDVVGYGGMKWDRKKNRWTFSARKVGGNPGTVTVKGPEGRWTEIVQ
jgi:bacillopeptidase F